MTRVNLFKPRSPFKGIVKKPIDKSIENPVTRILTEQAVIFIRKSYTEFGPGELSRMFNVSRQTIINAARGITWGFLNYKYPPIA
jgi:hypothetical protein